MSQGVYKVETNPVQGRTYPNKHGGNLAVWRLGLKDAESAAPDNLFELHKKEGNAPPQIGDEIEVDRFASGEHNGEGYTRIFSAYTQPGGNDGHGRPSSGGQARQSDGPGLQWKSAPFERGAEHPRNEARMIHTSALSAAPAFVEQMLTLNVVEQPKDANEYWVLVGYVAGRLAKSYQKALSATVGPPATQNGGGGEVPADTADMNPHAAQAADESIPF